MISMFPKSTFRLQAQVQLKLLTNTPPCNGMKVNRLPWLHGLILMFWFSYSPSKLALATKHHQLHKEALPYLYLGGCQNPATVDKYSIHFDYIREPYQGKVRKSSCCVAEFFCQTRLEPTTVVVGQRALSGMSFFFLRTCTGLAPSQIIRANQDHMFGQFPLIGRIFETALKHKPWF